MWQTCMLSNISHLEALTLGDSACMFAHILIRLHTDMCTLTYTRTSAHTCAQELKDPHTGRTPTCAFAHTNLGTLSLVGSRGAGTLSLIRVSKDPYMCGLIVPSAVQLSCSGRFGGLYTERERERERESVCVCVCACACACVCVCVCVHSTCI